MKAALDLLTENQKLIEKHNDEYDVKTGTSSDSCYNIGLLKNQMDEILNQIEKSIEELERIKANKAPINDGLRAQSDELEYKIRFFANSAYNCREDLAEVQSTSVDRCAG
ncbi:hypothetical protein BASA83_011098 [Batrachochytrium salamandrivorans]|nr:hypothetical protein BASA83_011098 [Batrachochytrium salamandrivorans]